MTAVLLCYGVALVLAVVAAAYVFEALEFHRRYRLISLLPTSTISSLQEGLREIKGRIVPLSLLKAPLTQRPCVYHQFRVDAKYPGLRKKDVWKTINSGGEGVPFLVDDGSGRILVSPEGAVMEVEDEKLLSTDGYERATPEARLEILGRMGLSAAEEREALGRIRCGEILLAPGDMMYALGQVSKIADQPEDGLRPEGVKFVVRRAGLSEFVLSNRSERAVLEVLAERRSYNLLIAGICGVAVAVVLVFSLFISSVPGDPVEPLPDPLHGRR
ncbi:MAG: hypothetical protein HYZ53_17515 [Planctomycetes bacterium]|nr:hypothetical protein [Planctomycetota bacterium]